ncbi:MAG: hypothetical protein ACRCU3_05055 [Eubacteriaceae bacterium]
MLKANFLLNVEVVSKKTGWRLGLVKSIVVVDHVVKYLVISPGGFLTKAKIIEPEKILSVDYKQLVINDESEITRLKSKEIQHFLKTAFLLMDVPIVDNTGANFGRVVNAHIDPNNYRILEYEISRSFFDDLNDGFAAILPDELFFENQVLTYKKGMFDLEDELKNGGIARKLLGVN